MNKQELSRSLARVRAELDRLQFDDPVASPQLEQLIAHAQRYETATLSPAQSAQLLAGLSAAVTRFEVAHPNLAAGLSQLISSLSSMGI